MGFFIEERPGAHPGGGMNIAWMFRVPLFDRFQRRSAR
jgi:hypothetical protein